jgi:uncharacterized protein with HEPN domain
MSKIDDSSRLHHMLDAATEAITFASARQRNDLDKDRMLTLSLVKEIEIIGEAASNISPECRDRYAEIPWVEIIGMRNRLIHAYFEVDLDIVWQVVTYDLPTLIDALRQVIEGL